MTANMKIELVKLIIEALKHEKKKVNAENIIGMYREIIRAICF